MTYLIVNSGLLFGLEARRGAEAADLNVEGYAKACLVSENCQSFVVSRGESYAKEALSLSF